MSGGGFGRYREIALLGQGGMARVVLAALPGPVGTQKLLVVKEMLPELAMDPEFVGMFTDEARLACRLDHPNLIQTYELAEVDGRYFFVMEYLEGQSLSVVLARTQRKMPLPIYLRVLTRVLAGLHYAHELCDLEGRPLGVVHRDVTPQNIFVCYGGAMKLVDFGIAKAAGAAILTKAGTFKGKIAYASKEQIANEPVDRRADIFAAGVLLWEGIAGQRITKDLAEPAILQRRFLGAEPDALAINPDAPPELAAIAKKALSPEREDRYATAAEMQAAIEAYVESAGARVADEDVGRYVAELFAEQRSQVRKLVQERLAKPAGESSSPLVVPAAISSSSLLAGSSPGGSEGGEGASSDSEASAAAAKMARAGHGAAGEMPTEVTASLEQPRVAKGAGRLWVAVAVVAVMVAGGVWVAVGRRGASANASANANANANANADEKKRVEVALVASPESARFSIDGKGLEGNPFKGRIVGDADAHTLEVSAPGFVTEKRAIRLDGALQLELALKVDPSGAAPITTATATATATAKTTGPRAVRPGEEPATRPNGARTAKPIDTGDPYGPGGSR